MAISWLVPVKETIKILGFFVFYYLRSDEILEVYCQKALEISFKQS